MNPVIAVLREHISNQNVSFVFPSQIASDLWARKTCTLGIARSVARRRFLAWDRFKEEVVAEKTVEKEAVRPSTSVMRRLFAESLVRKNAELPFLKNLIPVEHSSRGAVFAPFIARLLPSLAYWEKLMKSSGRGNQGAAIDAEDADYELIKNEYAAFLGRHGLFEPSWEEMKTLQGNQRYVIFFPELIEDFAEYDALLPEPQFIRIGAERAPGPAGLVFYQSAREEIRSAVIELQKLHEDEGVPYEDMAISVPEAEEMEPNLLLELSLRHVPFVRRAGKKLGETGAGRLFSLVNECAASRFSFNSLKALLLNDHIPWRESEKNKSLVSFGIKYNCVSGYSQNGKSVDIWEEAFKEALNDNGQKIETKNLQRHYWKLKEAVFSLAGADSFNGIKKSYFNFWNNPYKKELLDMEKISEDDDAVLSRCIVELSSLIDLEERFNEAALVPASPFGFFISHLGETVYVRDVKKTGVNIYPWRAAAASPFSCHFVLNASQDAASVIYRPLKFLRQDKRKRLGLEDKDATGAFFLLCDAGEDGGFKSRTRISASAQTFSGWAIPHSFFAQGKTLVPPPCPDDPYRDERRFWKEFDRGAVPALQKIFPMQKSSYELWKSAFAKKENKFSFFSRPVPSGTITSEDTGMSCSAGELLKNAILGKDGYLVVTPTRDLNVYYYCPLFWLYARIFVVKEFSLEAALLDDTSLGLLYHKILEELFARIKNEEEVFDSDRLETYKRWALEITRSAIKEHPAFKGPLAVPLVSPQAAGMSKKIAGLLDLEAKFLNGYKVADLELPVSLKTGELLIQGVVDRVSVSPEGEPVIIDYKTTYLPEQTALEDLAEGEVLLSEFQMPLYIKLCEAQSAAKTGNAVKVRGAFFYSINGRKIKTVLGEKNTGRTKAPTREEYEPILEAAENQIKEFAEKVKALDFIPRELRIKDCLGCMYKTVCRSVYRI